MFKVVAVCLALPLIAILCFILGDDFGNPLRMPSNKGGWFYEYQTLFSGMLAGIIAACSVRLTWHQYKEDQRRKEFSARANLPDALGEMCEYSKNCFYFIWKNEQNFPEKPVEAFSDIKSCIEYVDKNTSQTIFNFVNFYQVHNSRLRAYKKDEANPDHFDRPELPLFDALKLHVLATQLFPYSRNEIYQAGTKETSKKELYSALLHITGIWSFDTSRIDQDKKIKAVVDKIERVEE